MQLIPDLKPARPLQSNDRQKAQSLGFQFRGQYVSHKMKGHYTLPQSAMAGYLVRMGYLL